MRFSHAAFCAHRIKLHDGRRETEQMRHDEIRLLTKVESEAGDDDVTSGSDNFHDNIRKVVVKKLRFVDGDDLMFGLHEFPQVRRRADLFCTTTKAAVRLDRIFGTRVCPRLHKQKRHLGNLRLTKPPQKFFALAGKHGTGDDDQFG